MESLKQYYNAFLNACLWRLPDPNSEVFHERWILQTAFGTLDDFSIARKMALRAVMLKKEKMKDEVKASLTEAFDLCTNSFNKKSPTLAEIESGDSILYQKIKALAGEKKVQYILGISEKILKKNFNLGEEGYDIARDEGRVKPSKDKKDGTSYPPSEEMKRTQKKNKGPSALEIVKKKYKGQIMDVDKKKKDKK